MLEVGQMERTTTKERKVRIGLGLSQQMVKEFAGFVEKKGISRSSVTNGLRGIKQSNRVQMLESRVWLSLKKLLTLQWS